jgi:peptidoglycan/LPS O-acetylase OafA/YrhL
VSRDLSLDGLRGVSILLVVGFHAGVVPGGWLGVSLFFSLSGYLITSMLLAEHDRSGTIVLGAFYRRRAARLLPALALALVGVCGLGLALGYGRLAAVDAVIAAAFLANVARAFWLTPLTPVSWAWTLSLEEQFYALWPPLLRRSLARADGRARLARRLVLWAVGLVLARLVLVEHLNVSYTLVRGDELLLGATLALIPVRIHRAVTWGALAVFAALLLVPFPRLLLVSLTLAPLCATVLVGSAQRFRPVLELRLLRYVGRVSYALYLWNGLLVAATPLHLPPVVYPALSFVLAAASTHLVEEPVRARLREKRARPRDALSRPVGA